MKYALLPIVAAVLLAACSRPQEPQQPQVQHAAQAPALAQPATHVVFTSAEAPQVPACTDARAQELAKEAVIRWIIVTGDEALMVRGALVATDAFQEDELQMGMNRLVDMTAFEATQEAGFTGVRRRCIARMTTAGWKLSVPVAFQIQAAQDDSRYAVDAQAPALAEGPEGFNLMIGLRATYGKALRPS